MGSFDVAAYLEAMDAALTRQGMRGVTVAETPAGPVRLWFDPAADGPRCRGFLSAGIHGDEPAGSLALLRYVQTEPLPPHRSWVVAPALNPTGLMRGTRHNAEGIDLNRDFLQRRSREVDGLMRWWETQTFACAFHLSLHEDWEATGLYLYALNTAAQACFAEKLVENLAPLVPLQAHGPVDGHPLTAPGLILHEPEPDEPDGWPEAIWLVKRAPATSYTIEAPGAFSPEERTDALRRALSLALRLDCDCGAEANGE